MERPTTSVPSTGALFLLGLMASSLITGFSESAPVRRHAGSNTTDPVWRMVAGAQTASNYIFYKQAVVYAEEPLVSVNDSTQSSELLDSILGGVCELVSVYDLISKVVTNDSDLHLLLTQNIVDACIWLNYLVDNTWNVTGSDEFLLLNRTCTPDSPMPRLRHYCLQKKVREPDQLIHLVQRTIHDGLSTYYPTPVTEEDQCHWLETSEAIAGDTRDRVEAGANLLCS